MALQPKWRNIFKQMCRSLGCVLKKWEGTRKERIEVDNVFLCSAVDQYLKWRIPSPSIKPLTASSPARRSRISGPFRHQDSVTVLPLPLKADCGRLKLLPKFPHFLFFNLPKWTNLLLSWNQQTLTSIR